MLACVAEMMRLELERAVLVIGCEVTQHWSWYWLRCWRLRCCCRCHLDVVVRAFSVLVRSIWPWSRDEATDACHWEVAMLLDEADQMTLLRS